MSLDRAEIELLADALIRRLDARDFEHLRGIVIDAVLDSTAKAMPEVLKNQTMLVLAEATDKNTSRTAFAAGWRAAFSYLGISGNFERRNETAESKALDAHMSERLSPYFDGREPQVQSASPSASAPGASG